MKTTPRRRRERERERRGKEKRAGDSTRELVVVVVGEEEGRQARQGKQRPGRARPSLGLGPPPSLPLSSSKG